MAAVALVIEEGRCPLTLGTKLWTSTGSWSALGGPGYVDVNPN